MINSVSGVSFRGEVANPQDLFNAPSKFSTPAPADMPADSFDKQGKEKKKGGFNGLLATIGVALATFVALGFAVKKGHLEKVEINEADGFFKKALQRGKNAAHTVGEYAIKAWDNTIGKLLNKGEKTAEAATESASTGATGAEA